MDKIDQRLAQLRLCGYCHAWYSKPCGEGCQWQPNDPTAASILPVAGETADNHTYEGNAPTCWTCGLPPDMHNAPSSTDETRAEEESHLGPTCDKRGRNHIWQTTEHGHDICVDCRLMRPTLSEPTAPQDDGLVERLNERNPWHPLYAEAAARIAALKAQVAEVTRERDEQNRLAVKGAEASVEYADLSVKATARAEKAEAELTALKEEHADCPSPILQTAWDVMKDDLTAARSTIAAQAEKIERVKGIVLKISKVLMAHRSGVNVVLTQRVMDQLVEDFDAALTEGEER